MNTTEILKIVQDSTTADVAINEEGPAPTLVVPASDIFPVLSCLKDTVGLDFDILMNQTALHKDEYLILYWHLYSYVHRHEVAIEAEVPITEPKIASVVSLWPGADWLERETYDLFGVVFEGHPNLKRIMLPPDWEGFPLRKDYVTPESYQKIDNRPSENSLSFQGQPKED